MHKGAFARRGLGMMRPFMVVVALLAVGKPVCRSGRPGSGNAVRFSGCGTSGIRSILGDAHHTAI